MRNICIGEGKSPLIKWIIRCIYFCDLFCTRDPVLWPTRGYRSIKSSLWCHMMVVKVQMREYRENYTNTTNECKQTKHTDSWLVMMWTLSHIITISFCFNLHSISTYVHITHSLVVQVQISLWTVQLVCDHSRCLLLSLSISSLLHINKSKCRKKSQLWQVSIISMVYDRDSGIMRLCTCIILRTIGEATSAATNTIHNVKYTTCITCIDWNIILSHHAASNTNSKCNSTFYYKISTVHTRCSKTKSYIINSV